MISLYNPNANARQRFFLSLISLQSYFEYLTYAMLVLSEYMSEKDYNDLQDSSKHIDAVFLAENILGNEFFAEEIIIHPENKIRIPRITKSSIKSIRSKFHTIRQLRNDVIHAWGYKDISLADLKKRLDEIVGRKNKLQVLPLSIENG